MAYELLNNSNRSSGGGGGHMIGEFVSTVRTVDDSGRHLLPSDTTFARGLYPDHDALYDSGDLLANGTNQGLGPVSGLKSILYTKVAGAPELPSNPGVSLGIKRYTDGLSFHAGVYMSSTNKINCIYTEDNGLSWNYKSATLPGVTSAWAWDWNPKTKEIISVAYGTNGFSSNSQTNKRINMYISVDDGVSFSATELDFNSQGNTGGVATRYIADFRSYTANFVRGEGAAIHQDGIASGAFVALTMRESPAPASANFPIVIKSFTDPSDPMSSGTIGTSTEAGHISYPGQFAGAVDFSHWCALSDGLLQYSTSRQSNTNGYRTSFIYNMDNITVYVVERFSIATGTFIPSPYAPGKWCGAQWLSSNGSARYHTDISLPTASANIASLVNPGSVTIVMPVSVSEAGTSIHHTAIPSKTETDLLGSGFCNIASLTTQYMHGGTSIIDTNHLDDDDYGVGAIARGRISAMDLLPVCGDDTHFYYIDRAKGTVSKVQYGVADITIVGYTIDGVPSNWLPYAKYCVGAPV